MAKRLEAALELGQTLGHGYYYVNDKLCIGQGKYKSAGTMSGFCWLFLADLTNKGNGKTEKEYYTWLTHSENIFYLDMEQTNVKDEYIQSFYAMGLDELLKYLDQQMRMFFPGESDVCDNRKVTCYSMSDAQKKSKLSLHVMYPMVVLSRDVSHQLAIALSRDPFFKVNHGPHDTNSWIDTSVYKANQMMRFPYCLKVDQKGVWPALYPYPEISMKDEAALHDFIMVCTLYPKGGGKRHVPKLPECVDKKSVSFSKKSVDVEQKTSVSIPELKKRMNDGRSKIEKMIFPESLIACSIQIIKEQLREKGDHDSVVSYDKHFTFKIERKSSETKCVCNEQRHSSNGQSVEVLMKAMEYRCFSTKCAGKSAKVPFNDNPLYKRMIRLEREDRFLNSETLEKIGDYFQPLFEKAKENRKTAIAAQWRFSYMRYINIYCKRMKFSDKYPVIVCHWETDGTRRWKTHRDGGQTTFGDDYINLPSKDLEIKRVKLPKFMLNQGMDHYESIYKDIYHDLEFVPRPVRDDPSDGMGDVFNSFNGFIITKEKAAEWAAANPKQYEEDKKSFCDHVRDEICDADVLAYDYYQNSIASHLQFPAKKKEVAMVVIGPQGVGKSLVIKKIGEIVGTDAVHTINSTDKLLKSFNKELENKIIVIGEEALWVGSPKDQNQVKCFMTEEHINIEPKGLDTYKVKCYILVYLNSNCEHVLAINLGERRFFVIKTSGRWEGVHTAEKEAHFAKLLRINAHAVAHFYYTRDVSTFNPRNIPQTAALREQQRHSTPKLNPIIQFWSDVLNGDVQGACEESRTVIDNDTHNPRKVIPDHRMLIEDGVFPQYVTPKVLFDNFYVPWSKATASTRYQDRDFKMPIDLLRKSAEIFGENFKKLKKKTMPWGCGLRRNCINFDSVDDKRDDKTEETTLEGMYRKCLAVWIEKKGGAAGGDVYEMEVEEMEDSKEKDIETQIDDWVNEPPKQPKRKSCDPKASNGKKKKLKAK